MGYYVRVLSTSEERIPLSLLESVIREENLSALLKVEAGSAEAWDDLVLSHADGREIAAIERNVVEAGSLGVEELEEFRQEIGNCKPDSAAHWLRDFFSRVRCIYAFQVLSGTDHKNGWEILGAIKDGIRAFAPAIMQADLEGFSNEDGYHILWQFKDSVSGTWWMGVIRDGKWTHFQMDLGDRKHREAFLLGEVPDGVRLAT